MALIVGALPHSEWRLVTPLLQALGWEPESSPAPEAWCAQAGQPDEGARGNCYLLVVDRPERCIANALSDGVDLRDALLAWQSGVEALLSVYRRAPERSVLVDVTRVLKAPEALVTWLETNQPAVLEGGRSGRALPHLGYIEDSGSLEQNLDRLVAAQAVEQSSAICALWADVEACLAPFTPSGNAGASVGLDVQSIQHQLKTARQYRLEGKLDALMAMHDEERRAREARIERLERERGDYQAKVGWLYDELRDKREHVEKAARLAQTVRFQSAEMEKFARDKHDEIETIRKMLRRSQDEMQRQAALIKTLMSERSQLRAQLGALRTSWIQWLLFPARWGYLAARGLANRLKGRRAHRAVEVVEQSELFDATWYAKQYPDVIQSGASPAEHYARFGGFEGRDPGPRFSSAGYLKRNPDIVASGVNPLVHYELHGKQEGRSSR